MLCFYAVLRLSWIVTEPKVFESAIALGYHMTVSHASALEP